jgi:hypothetical protein
MALRDHLLDLEKRLNKLAGARPPREPLEIRRAVLQAIVDLAQPAGRSRRVLPFDRVRVEVLAPTADARRVFEAVFARDEGLAAAARRDLATIGCEPGPTFTVNVHYRKRVPAAWAAEQTYAVHGEIDEERSGTGERHGPTTSPQHRETTAPAADGAPAAVPALVLTVLKGHALRKRVQLRLSRINIGRQEEVLDRDQRLVRRNHVAFTDEDEINRTVSRAHAHIRFVAGSGPFRLRDDNSAYGTRIVRDGRTIDVSPGNARGVRLASGDELQFGRAIVRFEEVE